MHSGEDLIAAAESLIPTLISRAPEDDEAGRIRSETFADFSRLSLTRVSQPKRWGGLELPLTVLMKIEMTLARGDQSASWAYAVTQGHAHNLALYEDRAQKDVWGEDPEAQIASPYNPLGTATSFKDGYKFKGQWKFSSGCDNCDWFLLGGIVDKDPSKYLVFLVPRSDVNIIDDWDVYGLKGTGSKSVAVEETFVPAYRTLPFGAGTEDFPFPGLEINKNPSYRVPYLIVFNRSLTATSIGGLAGLIDAVTDYLAPKVSVFTATAVSEHPDTVLTLGQAKATLEELKILADHDLTTLERLAVENRMPSEAELNLYRYRAQEAGMRCVNAARKLFEVTGGGGLYQSRPIGRIYRNLTAAANHPVCGLYRDTARATGIEMFRSFRGSKPKEATGLAADFRH